MKIRTHKKLKALSMLQIMFYILAAGVITALTVPGLLDMIVKAKQTEAKNQLEHIHTLQELHHLEFSKYSMELKKIGYTQDKLVTEDGRARYKVEIVSAEGGTYVARATSVEDFDNDGVFNIWEINQDRVLKEIQED